MKFNDAQLKLLSSSRGLRYLLEEDKPDFRETVERLEFKSELYRLKAELVQLQNWVVEKKKRVLILFEGREFAGKGETARTITEHLNPREMRLVALQKPTDDERAQWYFKRYIRQIPEVGELVIFDRSWYNRALVEPVHGFCNDEEYELFMKEVNHFERMLVDDGVIMLKFFMTISRKEQGRRIDTIKSNPLKAWQLTKVDLEAFDLYDKYTKYKKAMLKQTNKKKNPWHKVDADNLDQAILEVFRMILKKIPYKR